MGAVCCADAGTSTPREYAPVTTPEQEVLAVAITEGGGRPIPLVSEEEDARVKKEEEERRAAELDAVRKKQEEEEATAKAEAEAQAKAEQDAAAAKANAKAEADAKAQAEAEAVARREQKTEIEVVCTKHSQQEGVGLKVMPDKNAIVVTAVVAGGPVERWNAENPTKQVKYGSVIYEINGVTGSMKDLLGVCISAPETLTMKVYRYDTFTVTVEKMGLLGLDLQANSTIIRKVTEPSAANPAPRLTMYTWNNSCELGKEIMRDDEVVEFNDMPVGHRELIQAVKVATGTLSFRILRH